MGVLLALGPAVGAVACATWLAVAVLFRFSSLASLLAVVAAPIAAHFIGLPQIRDVAIFIALVVIARHYTNIRRLLKGEEPRIGKGK